MYGKETGLKSIHDEYSLNIF